MGGKRSQQKLGSAFEFLNNIRKDLKQDSLPIIGKGLQNYK